jgi:hypothetical protein
MVVTDMETATAVAIRQLRWRQRQKDPVHALGRVEYERDAVLQTLINTGRFSVQP